DQWTGSQEDLQTKKMTLYFQLPTSYFNLPSSTSQLPTSIFLLQSSIFELSSSDFPFMSSVGRRQMIPNFQIVRLSSCEAFLSGLPSFFLFQPNHKKGLLEQSEHLHLLRLFAGRLHSFYCFFSTPRPKPVLLRLQRRPYFPLHPGTNGEYNDH